MYIPVLISALKGTSVGDGIGTASWKFRSCNSAGTLVKSDSDSSVENEVAHLSYWHIPNISHLRVRKRQCQQPRKWLDRGFAGALRSHGLHEHLFQGSIVHGRLCGQPARQSRERSQP